MHTFIWVCVCMWVCTCVQMENLSCSWAEATKIWLDAIPEIVVQDEHVSRGFFDTDPTPDFSFSGQKPWRGTVLPSCRQQTPRSTSTRPCWSRGGGCAAKSRTSTGQLGNLASSAAAPWSPTSAGAPWRPPGHSQPSWGCPWAPPRSEPLCWPQPWAWAWPRPAAPSVSLPTSSWCSAIPGRWGRCRKLRWLVGNRWGKYWAAWSSFAGGRAQATPRCGSQRRERPSRSTTPSASWSSAAATASSCQSTQRRPLK